MEPIRDVWDDRSRQVAEAVEPYGSSRPAGPIPAGSSHALAAIVGRIVRLVDPERIVLFGSRARGDAREDSDYDLLVVMDQIDDRRATRLALRGALDDLPISKDIVVATVEEVEGRSGRPWGVLHWAIRDGRTIYDRV
ncbi:MAG TPA: nucleotidyltransferase domain-containing protein [Candidatus Eisenbacteria bacterium]|nr:nucleotidyltransferase domain-containing protein [Candidatus Eisenbacteria bacterium]